MIMIKKPYKLKIVSIMLAVVFLFYSSLFAGEVCLRPKIGEYDRVEGAIFSRLCNRLSESKSYDEIIETLKEITAFTGEEEVAENFASSFGILQFFRLLNEVLYYTKQMTEPYAEWNSFDGLKYYRGNIKIEVRKILRNIFGSPDLSQIITKELAINGTTSNEKIILDFLDGDGGESCSFMDEKFPEILLLLKDPQKVKDLVLVLSLFRLVHYNPFLPPERHKGTKGTQEIVLEYAIRKGIYISIGNGLYITPISESFRRHIVFRMNDEKEISDAVEIFIIGDDRKVGRYLLSDKRLKFCQDMYESFGDGCGIIKTHLMATYSKEVVPQVEAYGDIFDYSEAKEPFRIFIYDYSYPIRGRRLERIDAMYLGRIAGEVASGKILNSKMAMPETIVRDVFATTKRFIEKGYTFEDPTGSDLHSGNFRLCLDGRVRFVNDFEAFGKGEEATEEILKLSFRIDSEAILKRGLALVLSSVLDNYGFDYEAILNRITILYTYYDILEEEDWIKFLSPNSSLKDLKEKILNEESRKDL